MDRAPFDLKTLAAVKPGLISAFTEISGGMERFFESPDTNIPALEGARKQLGGLLGVLKMAGLDGLAVYCAELESVLIEMIAHSQQLTGMSSDILRRAVSGVTDYLDALANGGNNATLNLFGQYQELQQLRGLEMSFKLDLFYPNLMIPPPQQIFDVPFRSDAIAHLKVLRTQYQQALLRWLKQDATAVTQMQQAVGGVISCVPANQGRAFWWISHALFDCIKQDDIPEEVNTRKLLSRIDQQMRAVVDGRSGDLQLVENEMLYIIGCGHADTEHTKTIKNWYALDRYLPNQAALSLAETERLRTVLREQLRGAQESWERSVQGDELSCDKFKTQVSELVLGCAELDRDNLHPLAKQIQIVADGIESIEQARHVAIDMAISLLLLESGIENYSHLGQDFQEQSQLVFDRMQATITQQPEDVAQLDRLVELHFQTTQAGIVIPLANEMLANLQRVEQGLNGFFNAQTERAELNGLLKSLSQVHGGLSMLSLQHADKLLTAIHNDVRDFMQNERALDPEKNLELAEAIGRLENYLQYVAHGQTADVGLLKASSVVIKTPVPVEPAVTAMVVEQAVVTPATGAGLDVAQVIAPPAIDFAPIETSAVETPSLAQVSSEQTSVLDVPVAVVAEVEMERPIIEDQELLDIFLEESQEVLTSICSNMESCATQPDNQTGLTTIRRGFHTLKGSGRMVGLNHLGEAAWNVERALNNWLQAKKPATPGLLGFLEMAAQSFAGWIDELSKQGGVRVNAEELAHAAQQVEAGVEPAISVVSQPATSRIVEPSSIEMTAAPMVESPAVESIAEFELNAIVQQEPVVVPTTPSAGLPSSITAEGESAEAVVTIGDKTLPLNLFNIASAEAMQNVAILQEQLDGLRAATEPVVQYDFMRAAHTLVGLNQAMGFVEAVDLAHSLESWLRAHLEPVAVMVHERQLNLIEESITSLGDMVLSICSLQPPQARSDLVEKLSADLNRTIAKPKYEPAEIPGKVMTQAAPIVPTEVVTFAKPVEVTGVEQKPEIQDEIEAELLPVFLDESEDLCANINEGLRTCREQPQNDSLLQSLKRHIHTMKGSSRMVGAMRIGDIAHQMEDSVAAAAKHSAEAGYWDGLEGDFDNIIALLEELRGGKRAVIVNKNLAAAPTEVAQRLVEQITAEPKAERRSLDASGERVAQNNMLRVRSDVLDRLVNEAGEMSVARSRIETELRTFKDGLSELTNSVSRLRQQLREVEIQAEGQMQARISLAQDSQEQFDPLEFDRFTRLQELTRFMNESVHDVQTVQQMLLKKLDDTATVMHGQARLNRDLQQRLMSVRMVSFNSISDRLYRIVRQTGKELNKRANLELKGITAELDRSVLEKMIAPFEHLLRNSIVHGLETSEVRAQAGKNAIGEISLGVRQEGNEVVFDFSDDGAGLNYVALRSKAMAGGLLGADEEVSDEQLAQLIFTSGLSTATAVTEIAGRGVGMDVVRSEIAGLGGRIDVSSKRGQGTQFTIYLPLTLAVTQIVLVRAGGDVFAIPAAMVEQVRQVRSADMQTLHQAQHLDWQGKQYGLLYLAQLLKDSGEFVLENQPRNSLLLLRSGEQRYALQVDELLGNQEAVVKNIGPQLSRHAGITGATVLGNGTVVMILNPAQLAQRISSTNKIIKAMAAKKLNVLPLIMVVDDSLTVRKITTRMLTRAGYQVVTATDGVDALEQLEEFTPDVMLLDIEMPRMDGFALAKELRRSPNTKNMPIIMITSRTADKHRDYAMQLGVNTYLGKPYQEDELLQNIAEFLAVHK